MEIDNLVHPFAFALNCDLNNPIVILLAVLECFYIISKSFYEQEVGSDNILILYTKYTSRRTKKREVKVFSFFQHLMDYCHNVSELQMKVYLMFASCYLLLLFKKIFFSCF